MSVVGTAVILGLLVVLLLRMKIARFSVVLVCVLFGLVLGSTPIGDSVNAALDLVRGLVLASAGGAVRALGPTRLDRQPVRVVEESVRISLWGVLAAWLARKLWRLLVAILRSPSTLAILTVLHGRGSWSAAGSVRFRC